MPETRETEFGTFIRQPSGHWALASPRETELINEPGIQAFGRSIMESFRQVGIASTGDPRNIGEFLESAQRSAELARFSPSATLAAQQTELVTSLIPGGPGLARGAGAATRAAFRSTAGLFGAGRRGPRQPIPPARGQRPDAEFPAVIDDPVETQLRSVGAAETQPVDGPAGLFNMLFEPGQLSAQQRALVPVAEEVGFLFFPGQVTGNRMFLETLQSNPVGRQMFAFELESNADALRQHVVRAVDLPPNTQMTRGILGETRRVLGGRFNAVRDAIGELDTTLGLDPDDIALLDETGFRSALTPAQRSRIDLTDMTPSQWMEVRSRLQGRAADFYAKGQKQAGDDVVNIVENGDQFLDDNLATAGKTEVMADWARVRSQWRVRMALERPGVITPDGDVSLKRLSANLEKFFRREFGEELIVPDAFRSQHPEIAAMLDFVRVARSFASNMPDSGTATRMFAGDVLANPSTLLKQKLSAQALRKLLDVSTPE